MKLDKLIFYLFKHWDNIKEQILAGSYRPEAILGQYIDKECGEGKRLLGIPTVLDRLIQQAIHQVLSSVWDKEFSDFSYGFRPHKNAGQAILQAQSYINSGKGYIVNIDLKSFFDKVNHDYLMTLIKRKVQSPQLLRLIWRYLRCPIQLNGGLQKRRIGVPQGGPLSPLLSNIVLNELDKEMERRGLKFVRYADDFCIFAKSRHAAYRIKGDICKFIRVKLHLEVNHTKSMVCTPTKFVYLGFTFVSSYLKGIKGRYQLIVAKPKFQKFIRELKRLTRKTTPMSFDERIKRVNWLIRDWINYFKHASMQEKLAKIDSWLRCRLRYCIWSRSLGRKSGKRNVAV